MKTDLQKLSEAFQDAIVYDGELSLEKMAEISRQLREKTGLSQRVIAAALDIKRGQWQRHESGYKITIDRYLETFKQLGFKTRIQITREL